MFDLKPGIRVQYGGLVGTTQTLLGGGLGIVWDGLCGEATPIASLCDPAQVYAIKNPAPARVFSTGDRVREYGTTRMGTVTDWRFGNTTVLWDGEKYALNNFSLPNLPLVPAEETTPDDKQLEQKRRKLAEYRGPQRTFPITTIKLVNLTSRWKNIPTSDQVVLMEALRACHQYAPFNEEWEFAWDTEKKEFQASLLPGKPFILTAPSCPDLAETVRAWYRRKDRGSA
jgi:hypothetical protein